MPDEHYPEGSVRTLLTTDFVTPATRAALEGRLAPPPPYTPEALDQDTFATLKALCARLYSAEGDPLNVAAEIDRRLAGGETDGWRFDALPPDDEAYRQCVTAIDRFAQERHGARFVGLNADDQARVIEALRAGQVPHHEDKRFFTDLLAECVEIVYSHPLMQEEIGYAGMADTRGWHQIGLNEREQWEPQPGEPYTLPEAAAPATPEPPQPAPPMRRYASDDEVDAIVIGTGAGGGPILARLAAAGMRVVALEAGRAWDARREFATDERAQSMLFWNDERLSAGADPIAFGRNNSGCGVGGSTIHYTAYTPRAQPDDFRLYDEFSVGCDWPFGYDELEPYYDELEQFLGISGPSPYPWGPPRRRAYPFAPLPLNGPAQLMQRGAATVGLRTSPAANAALGAAREQQGYGVRSACTNRGFCQAGCNNGAKGSMDVTFIPLAVALGAEVRPECFVTGFERDTRGRITGVLYQQNGATQRQRCKAVFLCAGAIESPRLLLMHNLANSSGQVGRNFMAHVGPQVWAQFDEFVRPTKGIPGGLISEDTHRPATADFAGGYLMQSIGVMPVTYVSQVARRLGAWGGELRKHMRVFNHVAGINILGDCLPQPQNYVELSDEPDARGLPKPRIHFTAGDNERRMQAHGIALMRQIWEAAGARDIWEFPRFAHIIGTCRMGDDPRRSVVDADCRSFDVPNLWICDNSVFPSALSVNPALTIMALALRTADRFVAQARRS